MRDIAFCGLAGYIVDWSREGLGAKPAYWDYKGCWASEAYNTARGLYKLRRPVVNPEVLLKTERFRYCAWTPSQNGHILDYLKSFAKHPRVELLSKAGTHWFCTKTSFLGQLERDKGLAAFFRLNLEDIKKCHYGCDVVRTAYRRGMSLDQADRWIELARDWRGYGLPATLDKVRVHEYLIGQKGCGNRHDYTQYIKNCLKLALDLTDTKVSFPKHFTARAKLVQAQADDVRRREKASHDRQERRRLAEETRARDWALTRVAIRFARLEKPSGSFRVRLPRKTKDILRQGKQLHNCLGDGYFGKDYADKMAKGEKIVAFVWKTSGRGPAAAVEYDPRRRKILQCYASKNSKPPAPVLAFVNRVFKGRRKAA
jgi:hypothetical protein